MSKGILAALLAGLGLALQPAPATAQGLTDDRELVIKVNKAIDKGIAFLKSQAKTSKVDGKTLVNWDSPFLKTLVGMDGGETALVTLALLNCGEKVSDPIVGAALEYLRRLPPNRTYVVGLTTMVFAEARQPRDLPLIQTNVDWLIKNGTRRSGSIIGWSYPFGPDQAPDASNTQYALLGLYAGKQAGAKIPDNVWREIRQLYLNGLGTDGAETGFWTYNHHKNGDASFSMTVAGVCGLLIASMGLSESQQQLDPVTGKAVKCGLYDTNDAIRRGLNWIGKSQNFAFQKARGSKSDFYNIYGIERVGRLSGLRFLGRADWYREGCQLLTGPDAKKGGQHQSGYWLYRDNGPFDKDVLQDDSHCIETSFALLFLSKGRTPVLMSKLAYGAMEMDAGVLIERGPANVTGWNRKHNDARHLTEFASRELFNGLPLGWQVYDPRRRDFKTEADITAEVAELVQTPILYFNGHERPRLNNQQKQIVKRYVEEGGFILAEACCGSTDFAAGFEELIQELFNSKLDDVKGDHAIWQSYFLVPPTDFKLKFLSRGCRTVVIFSPEPLAGYWEESKYMPPKTKKDVARGEQAFRLAANVIAYATGMEPPKQRLTVAKIAKLTNIDQSPPKGFIKPAQVQLGEAPPAQNAMRNLMAHLRTAARIDTVLDKQVMPPHDPELFKYKFMYAHGRVRFDLPDEAIKNLKANLQAGGLLFADACCGKPEFDQAFRAMVKKLFPGHSLQVIEQNDDLYSAKLNGAAITTVKRREKADGAGPDGGFKDLPPNLEGIKIDGRWVVIYSKYDIGCALENHKATDCLGHDRESALKLATAAVLYALKK